jgi:hypothetical protein
VSKRKNKRNKRNKPDDCPLVQVVWTDSKLVLEGWRPVADYRHVQKGSRVVSVGYMLQHPKHGTVVIAGSMTDQPSVSGVVQIPVCSIRTIFKLKDGEKLYGR